MEKRSDVKLIKDDIRIMDSHGKTLGSHKYER